MVWSEVHDPWHNMLPATLMAAVPIVVPLGCLAFPHMKTHRAARLATRRTHGQAAPGAEGRAHDVSAVVTGSVLPTEENVRLNAPGPVTAPGRVARPRSRSPRVRAIDSGLPLSASAY